MSGIARESKLKSAKPLRHFTSSKPTSKVKMTSRCIAGSCFLTAKVRRNGLNVGNAKRGHVRVVYIIMAMHLHVKCALMRDYGTIFQKVAHFAFPFFIHIYV